MSPRELRPHPATPAPQGLTVSAAIDVAADAKASLTFRLAGNLDLVRVPELAPARRADRLWERTCFEAFLAPGDGERYVELNCSPSSEWAVYQFDGYRRGVRALEVAPPVIEVVTTAHTLIVTASVDLAARGIAPSSWRIGLTAVVATAAGQLSYWALAHPRARPDFHDAAGWTLAIEGTTR